MPPASGITIPHAPSLPRPAQAYRAFLIKYSRHMEISWEEYSILEKTVSYRFAAEALSRMILKMDAEPEGADTLSHYQTAARLATASRAIYIASDIPTPSRFNPKIIIGSTHNDDLSQPPNRSTNLLEFLSTWIWTHDTPDPFWGRKLTAGGLIAAWDGKEFNYDHARRYWHTKEIIKMKIRASSWGMEYSARQEFCWLTKAISISLLIRYLEVQILMGCYLTWTEYPDEWIPVETVERLLLMDQFNEIAVLAVENVLYGNRNLDDPWPACLVDMLGALKITISTP